MSEGGTTLERDARGWLVGLDLGLAELERGGLAVLTSIAFTEFASVWAKEAPATGDPFEGRPAGGAYRSVITIPGWLVERAEKLARRFDVDRAQVFEWAARLGARSTAALVSESA